MADRKETAEEQRNKERRATEPGSPEHLGSDRPYEGEKSEPAEDKEKK